MRATACPATQIELTGEWSHGGVVEIRVREYSDGDGDGDGAHHAGE